MTLKKIIGKIHLWLGLVSGLVVFIVAITGCIYCFQEEIQEAVQEYRFVSPEHKAYLPPTELRKKAVTTLPGKHLHSLQYGGKNRAVVASFYQGGDYYYLVYLNPYTGKVLKVKDMDADFFRIILNGHYYLWLPPVIGQPIVAVSTLLFTLLLISGIILWWPKKYNRKQRFKIKWDARWRRKNYDMHTVLGFYSCLFGLLLALTGLVWGFQWFAGSVYWVASGGKTMTPYEEVLSVSDTSKVAAYSEPVDEIWSNLSAAFPNAILDVHFPEGKNGSIEMAINPDRGTYWKTDYRYYDQRTLRELKAKHVYSRFKDANTADLVLRMNYDIHVGQIGGIWGKIIAFCASLLIASLPVTGTLIWWGRKSKSKQPVTGRRAVAR